MTKQPQADSLMCSHILRCYFSCRAVELQYLWYRGTENTVNYHATPWCSAVDWGSGASSALRVLLWLAWTVREANPAVVSGMELFTRGAPLIHSWGSHEPEPAQIYYRSMLCISVVFAVAWFPSVCPSVCLSVCHDGDS